MNTPYVKQYNEAREVINPLEKKVGRNGKCAASYDSKITRNRRERNEKTERFKGNKKGVSLTVAGRFRYTRVIQEIRDKETGMIVKRIQQYILN